MKKKYIMRKLLLLLLFISGMTHAQIVTIPDTNLKTELLQASPTYYIAKNLSGNFFKIDSNSDGEIQVAEAAQVSYLYLRSMNISNMTGIENFVNVSELICEVNTISSLNISALTSLTILRCGNNNLSSIDVSSLGNLVQFNCENNQIATLNVSNLNNLVNFNCSHNQLSSLNVSNMAGLSQLFMNDNAITAINLSANNNLQYLDCQNNQLSVLNVSNLVNVSDISCYGNPFTNLSFQNLPNLISLACGNSQLSAVSLVNLPALTNLSVGGSGITSLDLSAHTGLTILGIGGTSMTAIDLSPLVNLQTIDISDNPNLLSLDLSSNSNLYNVRIHSDDALTHINLKNGTVQNIDQLFYDTSLLSLQYICGDDAELGILQSEIDTFYSSYNVSVNTYCFFTPGGDYNTITGTATIDANNNGCTVSDPPASFLGLNVSINGVSTNSSVFTNALGIYNLFTSFPGIYQLTPNLENPSYFNVSPITANSSVIDNSTIIENICIEPNGVHPDLEIVIAPITPARPGFDAVYQIVYRNKGNQILSQLYGINFFYNQNLMEFVSATTPTSSANLGSLSWDYANLMPFESRSIYVTMNINAPTDANPVNIGDVLQLTASVLVTADETTSDNLFQYNQIVVGSFDPNDITCIEGDVVSPSQIGNYLHYVINFENTGTAEAQNIVVKDIIDSTKFDIQSLKILDSSHPVSAKVSANVAEFVFENISLDSGGHGNILLKIKTKQNLSVGDEVANKADIFFDYNLPIETNVAETVFQSLLGVDENTIDNSISVYPNPTRNLVNIKSISDIKLVELYDVQGRLLMTRISNQMNETIDLTSKSNGIYFIKITTDKGIKVEKIVRK